MKFFSSVWGKIKNMKKGTKIGWLLIALSIVLSVWVIIAQSSKADEENGFVFNDGALSGYDGGRTAITGIPESVYRIEASAFSTTNINSIEMGPSIEELAPGCFAGCDSLEKVTGGAYAEIPAQCFYNCGNLTSYTMPGTVTSIGSQAFQGAGISKITIPAKVTYIAPDAFDGAYNLTDITVASGNSLYSSHNGCLYNYRGNKLEMVPVGASSAEIYSDATTIGSGAFSGCYGITSLRIPSGVKTIEDGAFSGSSIREIWIPDTVDEIGRDQGGWVPATIYGEAGTEAEKYAQEKSFAFESTDTPVDPDGPDPGTDPDPGHSGSDSSSSSSESSSTPASSSQQQSGQDQSGQGSQSGTTPGGNGGQGGTTPSGQGGTTPTPGGGNAGGNTGGGTNQGGAADNGRNQGGGTYYNGGGGGGTHTPDSTPKTADGDIDPRFIIVIAVLAAGLSLIIVGRRKKSVIVKQKREEKLDD